MLFPIYTTCSVPTPVTESAAMKLLISTLRSCVDNKTSLLLFQGEPGSGKKSLAMYYHTVTRKPGAPIAILDYAEYTAGNLCPVLSGGNDTPGILEKIHGGSLILLNPHILDLQCQLFLLELIEKQHYYNINLIGIDSGGLASQMGKGKFHTVLYQFFMQTRISVPPLRDRRDDIPFLVDNILKKLSRKYNKNLHGVSDHIMNLLLSCPWKRNIAELENVLEYAAAQCHTSLIKDDALLPTYLISASSNNSTTDKTLSELRSFSVVQKELILETLQKTGNNKSRTARILGMDRSTLYRKMAKYKIKI